jgi:hypothetical protein
MHDREWSELQSTERLNAATIRRSTGRNEGGGPDDSDAYLVLSSILMNGISLPASDVSAILRSGTLQEHEQIEQVCGKFHKLQSGILQHEHLRWTTRCGCRESSQTLRLLCL